MTVLMTEHVVVAAFPLQLDANAIKVTIGGNTVRKNGVAFRRVRSDESKREGADRHGSTFLFFLPFALTPRAPCGLFSLARGART